MQWYAKQFCEQSASWLEMVLDVLPIINGIIYWAWLWFILIKVSWDICYQEVYTMVVQYALPYHIADSYWRMLVNI